MSPEVNILFNPLPFLLNPNFRKKLKFQDQSHLCINPFHYEEKLKIDVNHYVKKGKCYRTVRVFPFWVELGNAAEGISGYLRSRD